MNELDMSCERDTFGHFLYS